MSIENWLPHIEACCASGMSKAAYAKQHHLNYSKLMYWCKKYMLGKSLQNGGDLVRVTLSETPQTKHELVTPNQAVLGILEFPNGARLSIHNPELLKSLPGLEL